MEIFCYNARKPREELTDFNSRIQSFCLDRPVIGLNPQVIGGQLVIAVTLADDVDTADASSLMPLVMEIDSLDDRLEEYLGEAVDSICEAHRESDPRLPIDVRVLPREDSPSSGFAVFYIVNGSVEAED